MSLTGLGRAVNLILGLSSRLYTKLHGTHDVKQLQHQHKHNTPTPIQKYFMYFYSRSINYSTVNY